MTDSDIQITHMEILQDYVVTSVEYRHGTDRMDRLGVREACIRVTFSDGDEMTVVRETGTRVVGNVPCAIWMDPSGEWLDEQVTLALEMACSHNILTPFNHWHTS
jgi:hypothetical protein